MSSFRSAVVTAKEQISCEENIQPHRVQTSQRMKGSFLMVFIDGDCSCPWTKGSASSEGSFVCNSFIVISQAEQGTNQQRQDALSADYGVAVVAASALYNLAIANHIYGLCNQSSRHLKQALQFYAISFKIKQQDRPCFNSTFTLYTLNNAAMIHRCMGEEEMSNKFLRRLYTTMSIIYSTDERKDQPHWAGLWGNVMCLVLDLRSTAASAA